jgi:hypothetical protein
MHTLANYCRFAGSCIFAPCLAGAFPNGILIGLLLLACGGGCGRVSPTSNDSENPGQAFNLAPFSRTIEPVSIYATHGAVANPTSVLTGKETLLSGMGSYIVVDFSREIGGIVTLNFTTASSNNESVGLAFSESSDFVGTNSDSSNGGPINTDGAIYASVMTTEPSSYTMPTKKVRGGFRYLTIFMNSNGSVGLGGISVAFSAVPLMAHPNAYPNYFYCNDDLINKIWYAGAYTVQTDIIVPTQGRVWGPPTSGWDNGATISGGASVLTDGAKRDRAVWAGDLGISTLTDYVSIDDTLSVRNALQRMYDSQMGSGELPMAGPPINIYDSDTYHLWTLLSSYNYFLETGDIAWLNSIWEKYKAGIAYITNKVNGPNGLLNVTGTNDWRPGQGGENLEANVLLYRVLATGTSLAAEQGDFSLAGEYWNEAATLKARINNILWDAAEGAYRDTPGSGIYPQDGNSLAVWFDVADSVSKSDSVSTYLATNWNALGATTPEWSGNISTFAGSMEIQAHFKASHDLDGLALIRREWGYMYNNPQGSKTFWEGFNADGSFAFNGSYMSNSHGWATGPTSALTFFVLGIVPTGIAGRQFSVIPHPGDLKHVEGNLTVAEGKEVVVRYDHANGDSFSMTVDSTKNTGSTAVIGIPKFSASRRVFINGAAAWEGDSFLGAGGVASADQDSNYIYFRDVQAGSRTFAYGGAL